MRRGEARENRRHDGLRGGRGDRETELASRCVAKRVDRLRCGLDRIERRAQPRQQSLTRLGGCYAAGRAIEQADALPFLDIADPVAQGRDGDAKAGRRPGEAPMLRNGRKSRHLHEIRATHCWVASNSRV